jgi:hypothetical protein
LATSFQVREGECRESWLPVRALDSPEGGGWRFGRIQVGRSKCPYPSGSSKYSQTRGQGQGPRLKRLLVSPELEGMSSPRSLWSFSAEPLHGATCKELARPNGNEGSFGEGDPEPLGETSSVIVAAFKFSVRLDFFCPPDNEAIGTQINYLAESFAGRPTGAFRTSRDVCAKLRAEEERESPQRIIRKECYVRCERG